MPNNAAAIYVQVWGAGGCAGQGSASGAIGGGGAYVGGFLTVIPPPGTNLTVAVGGASIQGNFAAPLFGGAPWPGSLNPGCSGSGAGATAIGPAGGAPLVVAGAGGAPGQSGAGGAARWDGRAGGGAGGGGRNNVASCVSPNGYGGSAASLPRLAGRGAGRGRGGPPARGPPSCRWGGFRRGGHRRGVAGPGGAGVSAAAGAGGG